MVGDPFVTIATLHDPVQARMLRDLLEQEGITTILPGVEHRGMLGIAGAFIAIPLKVRSSCAAEATEIVQALEHPEAAFPPGEEIPSLRQPPLGEAGGGRGGPYRGTDDSTAGRPKQLRGVGGLFLGLLFALLLLGGLAVSWFEEHAYPLGSASGEPSVERRSRSFGQMLRDSGLVP